MNKLMQITSNFFLFGLLLLLLAFPLSVIDIADLEPSYNAQVLSSQSAQMPVTVDTSTLPDVYLAPSQEPAQSSPSINLPDYPYYQMPSLYLGVPEGVE